MEADGLRGVLVVKPAGWALAWDCLGLDLFALVLLLIPVTRVPDNLKGRTVFVLLMFSEGTAHGHLTLCRWTGHRDGRRTWQRNSRADKKQTGLLSLGWVSSIILSPSPRGTITHIQIVGVFHTQLIFGNEEACFTSLLGGSKPGKVKQ